MKPFRILTPCALILLLSGVFSPLIGAEAKSVITDAQPMRVRFTWVATEDRPFTDAEIKRIANSYAWVIIEKNHDSFDFKQQDEEARRLKAANPAIHVFANYLAGLQNPGFEKAFTPLGFKEEWFLTNEKTSGEQKRGDKIPFVIQQKIHGHFVDVSNPDYRHFLVHVAAARLKNSSFDGVMFDNFRPPLGKVSAGLSHARLQEQWNGLGLLMDEARATVPSGKLVLFNGITRGDGEQHRGLEYLKKADAGHDEYFCYRGGPDKFRPAEQLREDIDLLPKYAAQGKIILYAVKLAKSKAINNPIRLAQVKRYSYGSFLMGWQPEHSFIQFRTAATIENGQLDGNDSPEVHLDLGSPKSAHSREESTLKREFSHGWVFVNQDASPKQIVVPDDVRRVDGGKATQQFHKGETCTIAGEDAAFFLNGH